jgi:hypothetical protein
MIGLGLTIFGALLLGVSLCLIGIPGVPPQAAAVILAITIIGAVLLGIGTIILLLWLFLCGSCRENCDLLAFLIDVLIFLVAAAGVLAVIGAILAALHLSQLCWLGWLIDTADFAIILLIAVWYSRVVGCTPWPRWVPDWARPRLPDVLRLICRG